MAQEAQLDSLYTERLAACEGLERALEDVQREVGAQTDEYQQVRTVPFFPVLKRQTLADMHAALAELRGAKQVSATKTESR